MKNLLGRNRLNASLINLEWDEEQQRVAGINELSLERLNDETNDEYVKRIEDYYQVKVKNYNN